MIPTNLTLSDTTAPTEFETVLNVTSGIILLLALVTGLINLTIFAVSYKAKLYSAYNLLILALVAIDTIDALILSPLWLASLTFWDGRMVIHVCTMNIVLSTFTFLGHHILIPTIACMRLLKGLYISLNPRTLKIVSYAGLFNCLTISLCCSIIRMFVNTNSNDQPNPATMFCTYLGRWYEAENENGHSFGWIGLFGLTLLSCITMTGFYIAIASKLRQQRKVSGAVPSNGAYYSPAKSIKSGIKAVVFFALAFLPIYTLPWITNVGWGVLTTSRTLTPFLVSITLLTGPMNAVIYVWKTSTHRLGLVALFPRKWQPAFRRILYRDDTNNTSQSQACETNVIENNTAYQMSGEPYRINKNLTQFQSLSLSESLPDATTEAHPNSGTEIQSNCYDEMCDGAVNLDEIRMEDPSSKNNTKQVRSVSNARSRKEILKTEQEEKKRPTLVLVKECKNEPTPGSSEDSDKAAPHAQWPNISTIGGSVQRKAEAIKKLSIRSGCSFKNPGLGSEEDSLQTPHRPRLATWSSSSKQAFRVRSPVLSKHNDVGVSPACSDVRIAASFEGLPITGEISMNNLIMRERSQTYGDARTGAMIANRLRQKRKKLGFLPQTRISHSPIESINVSN